MGIKYQSKQRRLQRARQIDTTLVPVLPNRYLLAHMKVYPQGFNLDGSYRKDYDPYINPMLRPSESLPNCPDGRYCK